MCNKVELCICSCLCYFVCVCVVVEIGRGTFRKEIVNLWFWKVIV